MGLRAPATRNVLFALQRRLDNDYEHQAARDRKYGALLGGAISGYSGASQARLAQEELESFAPPGTEDQERYDGGGFLGRLQSGLGGFDSYARATARPYRQQMQADLRGWDDHYRGEEREGYAQTLGLTMPDGSPVQNPRQVPMSALEELHRMKREKDERARQEAYNQDFADSLGDEADYDFGAFDPADQVRLLSRLQRQNAPPKPTKDVAGYASSLKVPYHEGMSFDDVRADHKRLNPATKTTKVEDDVRGYAESLGVPFFEGMTMSDVRADHKRLNPDPEPVDQDEAQARAAAEEFGLRDWYKPGMSMAQVIAEKNRRTEEGKPQHGINARNLSSATDLQHRQWNSIMHEPLSPTPPEGEEERHLWGNAVMAMLLETYYDRHRGVIPRHQNFAPYVSNLSDEEAQRLARFRDSLGAQ